MNTMGNRRSLVSILLMMVSVSHAQQEGPPAIPGTRIAPARVLIDAPAFEGPASSVSFSPDNKQILTIDRTSRQGVALRDATTGAVIRWIGDGNRPCVNARFVGNDLIAIVWARTSRGAEVGPEHPITLHGINDGALRHTLTPAAEPNDLSVAIASTRDGKRLITLTSHCEIWDTETGKRLIDIPKPLGDQPRPSSGLRSIRVTPDDKRLLLGDPTGRWGQFDLADGKLIGKLQRGDRPGPVTFSHDGKIASFGRLELRFANAETGELIDLKLPSTQPAPVAPPATQPTTGPAEGETIAPYVDAAFSPDGKWWAAQKKNQVEVYDITQSPPVLAHQFQLDASQRHLLEWSGDSKRLLAAGGETGRVSDWNIATGRPTHADLAHQHLIRTLAFSPGGDEMLSADARGRLVRWSLPDFKPVQTRPEVAPEALSYVINHAWYLADGKTVLTEGEQGTFSWLNRDDLTNTRRYNVTGKARVDCFALTADAGQLALRSSTLKPRVQFFKPPATERFADLDIQPNIRDMVFSPDGKQFAYLTPEGIPLLTMPDRQQIATLTPAPPATPSSIRQIHCTSDGQWIIGAGSNTLSAWPLRSKGDTPPTWQTSLSVNGPLTVTAGSSLICVPGQTGVQVVELLTGQIVAVLEVADVPARLAATVPGTSLVVTVSSGRRMAAYDLPTLITATPALQTAVQNATAMELWDWIDAEAGRAHAAILELNRRGELLPRVHRWLEASKDRFEQQRRVAQLLEQLSDPDTRTREKAHRELERLAGTIRPALQTAATGATGETAERLASLIRLAGDEETPSGTSDDALRTSRLRCVMSWSKEKETMAVVKLLPP